VSEALHDIGEDGGGLICAGFLNDVLPVGFEISGYPVLSPFNVWNELSDDTLFISVLHMAKQAPERMARIAALGIPAARWAIVRHPFAPIARDVAVGPGSYIGPHAVVMPGAAMGRHASLRPGCSIGHDTKLDEFVFVGPNPTLNGNCTVGRNSVSASFSCKAPAPCLNRPWGRSRRNPTYGSRRKLCE